MRLACGTCSAVQVVSSPGQRAEEEGVSSEADLRCVECGGVLREQADQSPATASSLAGEEEAIELDHLSESSLALANQLSIEHALPADVVSLESEPWFELEKPFDDVPLTAAPLSAHAPEVAENALSLEAASSSSAGPSQQAEATSTHDVELASAASAAQQDESLLASESSTDAEPSVELVLTTPMLARAPEGALRSAKPPKRVPPPPPVSRSPHSSSTQLPPTQFGRASSATYPPAARARAGSRADILRPQSDGSRASSQLGLTGSQAALSLDAPSPDVSAPRTRTGSRPKVLLAHVEESASPEKPTPTIRSRLNTRAPPARAGADQAPSSMAGDAEQQPPTVGSPTDPQPSTSVRVPPVGPPRTTLPGDRWYVLTPRGQVGPYKADEFASRLETGELSWDMLIWRNGLRDWKPGRRDDLLVIAVAGTLGLGNKTTPLEGLSALMRSSSSAVAPRAPNAPSEWLVDEEDTRLESWPLGMRLRPDLPPHTASTQQALPRQGLPNTLSAQRSLPAEPSVARAPLAGHRPPSQQLSLPPQSSRPPRQPSSQFMLSSQQGMRSSQVGSLSSQHALPAQPSLSLQQALSTSVPGSPTQRVRVPGTHPPPPLSARNTGSFSATGARDIPTGRFPRSSANSPEIKRGGGRATFIAIVAFGAGAAVALSSGHILELSRSGGRFDALSRIAFGEPAAQAKSPTSEPGTSSQLAALLRPAEEPPASTPSLAEGLRAATPPASPSTGESSAGPSSLGATSAAPKASPATPGNLEIVTRSLPAPEEVRDELKRLSSSLSRCVRTPAAGLDVELTVVGVTGSVSKVDVHAPELTPGRLECLKEGFSDLRVAPFVSEQLKYRHRFVW